jgi:sterol desaturase/sphingolipid hydroxylase (fatty acid hydroxylase superfamily)
VSHFLTSMLLWLPGCVLFLAFYEYAGHRWPLHEALRFTRRLDLASDHRLHHKLYALHFEGAEIPAWYDALHVRGLFAALWSSVLMTPVFLWLSAPLAVVFVITAIVHGVFWQWIHVQMHQPSCAWMISTRYFRFVRDFHAVHHHMARTNYGFALPPLFDWVFGTYCRQISRQAVQCAPGAGHVRDGCLPAADESGPLPTVRPSSCRERSRCPP